MFNKFRKLTAASVIFANLLFAVSVSAQKSNGGGANAASAGKFGNVEGITAKQMRDWLTYIASDELEGRDTPSKGLDLAAKYIAEHLAKIGIKPAGDEGTYFQKFPLRQSKIVAKSTKLSFNGQQFEYGSDFLTSLVPAELAGSGVVFAGNGWVVKSKNINPYQGIDVKDKVVVVVNSLPKGVTFGDLKGPVGGDWMSPPFYAQMNGAKAVITFATFGNLANWEGTKWTQSEKGIVEFGEQKSLINIPSISASPKLITALFQGEKFSGGNLFAKAVSGEPLESFSLKPEKRVNVSVAVKKENIHSQNVVGVLEGSDPVLKNEYVAVGAHYDHVGMNPYAIGPDKIFNGADDDGSGTVAVMAIAEAFAKGPRPKRSILFIWHAGEEKGLWGSEYYSNNPTVPISSIVTQLNIDMIGRAQNANDIANARNKNLPKNGEVFLIGSKMMSTELGEVSESTNKSFLNMSFNYKYDDPNDPEQYFYRSDHFNYARKGIPIIFYMDGDHDDYHQLSDSIEKIDFENMEKIARTIMATGWELANRPTRPKVDKPLPASVTQN